MARHRVDLLVLGSKETITVDGAIEQDDLGVIDDGGVAIHDGCVVQAASSQLLERKYAAKSVLDVNGEIVVPGLVDPHTHLVFEGSREHEFQLRVGGASYMEILKNGGGILETVNRTRQAGTELLEKEAAKRLDTALESGTTTIEAKSGYGLRTQDEIRILSIIRKVARQHPSRVVPTFLGAHALPPEHSEQENYSETIIREMLPLVRRSRLAVFCDVFCEEGAFDERWALKILRAAAEHGLKLKIHADEFTNCGGSSVANTVRAVSADHLVNSPTKQLSRMRNSGVVPVLLPASSHSLLMERYARARDMLSMGLPVALGTDFSPANWLLSQLTVAAIAARNLRMNAAEAIRGITVNAAMALRLQNRIGTISPGKQADLAILSVPSHKWIGYAYGEGLVDKVLIGGKLVVNGGKRVS